MKLRDFDFELPRELIARFPAQRREESRLMVVERKSGKIGHYRFRDIADLLDENNFLVVNNSRVAPARFLGRIGERAVDFLWVRNISVDEIEVLASPAKHFFIGAMVHISDQPVAMVSGAGERGCRTLKILCPPEKLFSLGFAPLPPYIKRREAEARQWREFDLERYQTVYARDSGSIAAPTAGLHFTPDILDHFKKKSTVIEISLNVGVATFQKIAVDDIRQHRMGREDIVITGHSREQIRLLRREKSLVAVGTTAVRSLETFAQINPAGEKFVSELFIYPGFKFQLVDKMVTNFHLPQSSLFILVSAFAGLELICEAYRVAVADRYHFFSYGDAMLIL